MKPGVKAMLFCLSVASATLTSHAQQVLQSENSYTAKNNKLFIPMIKQDGLKLHIQFENPANEKIQISFRSTDGDEWMRDTKSSFIDKVYDLSSLDDGEYDLKITKGQQYLDRKVILHTDYSSTRHVIF